MIALVVTGALVCGGLVPSPASAGAAPVASPSPGRATTKYYVVGTPGEGHREYLFAIAAKTLGDGNRYVEIFNLNKGRLQPDGRRMEDPTVVEPGWVLLLPEDAEGPGVRVGPLPTPHTGTDDTVAPAHGHAAADTGGVMEQTIALIALIALSLLLWWACRLLGRIRPSLPLLNRVRAEPRAVAGSPAPVEGVQPAAVAADPDLLVGEDGPDGRQDRPDAQADRSPNGNLPTTAASSRERSDTDSSDPHSVEPDLPEPNSPGLRQSSDTSHTAPLAGQSADAPASPRPSVLRTEVVSGQDIVAVQLAGVRALPRSAPAGWVYDAQPPTGAPAMVALGENDQGRLYVNLSLVPDVLTITGSAESRQRQALSLTRQLVEAGVAVTAVGNPFGAPDPPGCRFVATIDEAIQEAAGTSDGLRVLFHAPSRDPRSSGEDTCLAAIRRALSLHQPRLVPVLIGNVQPGRWSTEVRPLEAAPTDGVASRTGKQRVVDVPLPPTGG